MVTIKKIEIKDYFGRGNFEWNLDPVVNILGGKNGSGKSTLFKLCYALLSNEILKVKIDKQFSSLFQEVVLTFSNEWTLIWVKPELRKEYILSLGGNPQTYKEVIVLDQNRNFQEYSKLSELVQVYMINSFEQQLTTLIQTIQDQKHLLANGMTTLDSLIDKQINLRNKDFSQTMESFVDSLEDEEEKRSNYIKLYRKIYASLSHFLTDYDEPFKSSFEFTKNGEHVGVEGLSMGEKQILLLLLMVSNTNQKPCIFFMDEPDLSMHIDWKEILVKELHELNPNMQIILSTHAPSVITGWHDKVKEVNQLIKK